MDHKKLEELHLEYARQSQEFLQDFKKLADKWFKKSPRLAIMNTIHLPLFIIMSLIEESENNEVYNVFPELPYTFVRLVAPFIKLREKWGKIPGEQFFKEYRDLYESQFDEFFIDENIKENFKKHFCDKT
jgi:hypothetical protein